MKEGLDVMHYKNMISSNFYNRHYITIRSDNVIIDAWSNGPLPEKDISGAICINTKGSYQFRLFPDGEENPPIYDFSNRIPLYKWNGSEIVHRTEEEINIERSAIPDPPPTTEDQLRADIDFLAVMMGVDL